MATRAADLLGARLREIVDIQLNELSQHCLIVYDKVSPTSGGYPRRAGMPVKRPLL